MKKYSKMTLCEIANATKWYHMSFQKQLLQILGTHAYKYHNTIETITKENIQKDIESTDLELEQESIHSNIYKYSIDLRLHTVLDIDPEAFAHAALRSGEGLEILTLPEYRSMIDDLKKSNENWKHKKELTTLLCHLRHSQFQKLRKGKTGKIRNTLGCPFGFWKAKKILMDFIKLKQEELNAKQ